MSLVTLAVPTALVVDVGYVECSVTPVIEGITSLDLVQFAPLGAKAIHERIHAELVKHHATSDHEQTVIDYIERMDEQVLEDIKVRTCFVAPFDRSQQLLHLKRTDDDKDKSKDIDSDTILNGCPKAVRYPVDGGQVLNISGMLRESACEVLFERYGHEANIAKLILEVLRLCARDSRKPLADNIVLIGGTTQLPGFRRRLHDELTALIAADNLYSGNLHFDAFRFHRTPCKANYAAWLGGAILGASDAINTRIITREQYLRSNGAVIKDWCDWWPTPAGVA